MQKIKDFFSKVWKGYKAGMQKSYDYIQAYTNGKWQKMVLFAFIYLFVSAFLIIGLGTSAIKGIFNASDTVVDVYTVFGFILIVAKYILWVLIGNGTIKQ